MRLSLARNSEADSHKRQTSLKRQGILAGFALLLVLLAGTTMVLKRNLMVQIGNQDWVTHTRLVLYELNQTESLLKDAETGQRGLLYTGDVKYFEPYDHAIAQIEMHIDRLAALTAANPAQQARLPELRNLSQEKLGELGETISFYFSNDPGQATALVMSDTGLVEMNRIHDIIAQMEEDESSLELSQTVILRKNIRVTLVLILSGQLSRRPGADCSGVRHPSRDESPREIPLRDMETRGILQGDR